MTILAEHIVDVIQQNIYVREDGAIVWQSILDKYIGPDTLKRILALTQDHVVNEREIEHVA